MNWLRKSLLLASVGCLSTAPLAAQTTAQRPNDPGVVLCRPQPLVEPLPASAAGMPRAVSSAPGFIVRGQMDEEAGKSLPSAEAIAEPRVKPLTQFSPYVVKPAVQQVTQLVEPQAALGTPIPDGSKTFHPPAPSPALSKYNPWTGLVDGAAGTPVVIDGLGGWNSMSTVPTFWGRAEYLLWWTKGDRLPVLVTTGSPTTPENIRGTLGQPDTTVLFGGSNTNQGPVSGGRFMLGYNFDPCGICGIDGGYFFLAQKNDNFFSNASVLARPFFNVNTGMPDRELTSSPGILPTDAFKLRGSIAVDDFTNLQGAELNARTLLLANNNAFLFGFAGFRWLELNEGLNITENVVSAAAVPGFSIFTPGNQIMVNDSFGTRNQFYGGQVGLDGELREGRWFVGGRLQLGLGVTHQTINVNGSQTVTTLAGATSTYQGGLLALPSNIGSYSQNRFSVVPQVGFRVGYNVTPNLRVFVGYDFLYWSSVVRPGAQVDTNLNVSQIPNFNPPGGGAFAPPSNVVRPVVPFTTTGFFAQGVSMGVEWRY